MRQWVLSVLLLANGFAPAANAGEPVVTRPRVTRFDTSQPVGPFVSTADRRPIGAASAASTQPANGLFIAAKWQEPSSADAETPPVQRVSSTLASPFDGDLATRPVLLGSVGGARDQLASNGVSVNVYSTQFYQGVTTGGTSRTFDFNGRNDYLVNVDGQKAGLWEGFFIAIHGETRYGDANGFKNGAIMPSNAGALFPTASGTVTALTGFQMTQALSENFITFAGKINTMDAIRQRYAAGRGVDAFMNMALVFPVTAARTVPYSTLGAGFAVLNEAQPVLTMMVLDTNNTPTSSGFDTFFTNGATILTRVETPVTLLDRPGNQAIWGTYSSGTYSDLAVTPYFDPQTGFGFATGTQTGSWTLIYSADQAFYVDPQDSRRSWGVFTNIGLADDGPSPVRWSANAGVGGSSPWASRPLDTFGVGYAFVNYSGPVHQIAPLLLPIRDDHVVELFYNFAVTPWLRVTPDLQILVPAREQTFALLPSNRQSIDTAVVFSLRAKLEF